MFKINYEYYSGILFVRIKGKLDKQNVKEIKEYLIPVILKQGIKYMVYNLYELSNIDNAGINGLISGVRAIKLNKGRVYMCEVPYQFENKLNKIQKVLNEKKAIEILDI